MENIRKCRKMQTLIQIRNTLLATFIVLSGWMAIPPKMFINPRYAVIEGTEVRVYRSFPSLNILGKPWIRRIEFVQDISPEHGQLPLTCEYRTDIIHLTVRNVEFGAWDISEWAEECMHGDYVWTAIWIPYLFGVIPLRPVSLEYVSPRNSTAGDREIITSPQPINLGD